jgi:SP family galactose:H+ symporter-like MFS transporter
VSRHRIWAVLTTLLASVAGLLFGYDTGVISGAMLFLRRVYALDAFWQGLVVSMVPIGAALGAACAAGLSGRFDRRPLLLLAAVLFLGGSLASAFAPGAPSLLAARLAVGVAIGLGSMLAPVYLSETSAASRRGLVVSLNQLCVTLGILLAYFVDLALAPERDWRLMLGLGVVPALVLFAGMLLAPPSPRWLFQHGDKDGARGVLRRLHPASAEEEFRALREDAEEERGRHGLSALLRPPAVWGLAVALALAVIQQVVGINAIVYFAPLIFEHAGLHGAGASLTATVGVGLVNVLFTVLALVLIDRLGRRPLLFAGYVGMGLSLGYLALAFAGGRSGLGTAAVVAIFAYIASFAVSIGPIFWLVAAEIFPLGVRAGGMALATVTNWMANFVVSLTFPTLLAALGGTWIFGIYALFCLLGLLFSWRYIPETKRLVLEEVSGALRRLWAPRTAVPLE